MRTILSTGEHARIVFRHTQTPRYVENPGTSGPKRVLIEYAREVPQAVTECMVISGTREAPVQHGELGVARCAWADAFNKETGRRIALDRAVENVPSVDRGRILRAYYERPRTPPFQVDAAQELLHMAIVVRDTSYGDVSSVKAAFDIFARLLEGRAADLILAKNREGRGRHP